MMPSLSFIYWSALVFAGALALYFGARKAGNASGVARLRGVPLRIPVLGPTRVPGVPKDPKTEVGDESPPPHLAGPLTEH